MEEKYTLNICIVILAWNAVQESTGYAFCSNRTDWLLIDNRIDVNMANQRCRYLCEQVGVRYYSLKRNGQKASDASCFCGHTRGSQCSGLCDYDCHGPCGGGGQSTSQSPCVSVFAVQTPYPVCTPVEGWTMVAEYSQTTAIQNCKDSCREPANGNYTVAGVKRNGPNANLARCYCGNSSLSYGNSRCSFRCDEQPCGDSDAISLYPVCLEGYYGLDCEFVCAHCVDIVCDVSTGSCSGNCLGGFYGHNCNTKCPQNCHIICDWVNGNCFENNTCRQYDGLCNYGCVDSYYGDRCNNNCAEGCKQTTCTQTGGVCDGGCADGWYTPTCTEQCSTECSDRRCDINTGLCFSCKSGWYGDGCNISCSVGCNQTTCTQSGGVCDGGCAVGWYTPTCTVRCPTQCTEQRCDMVTGRCHSCNSGWYGEICSEKCSTYCNQAECDFVSGECTYGCKPGYFTEHCNIPCSSHCLYDLCYIQNGFCSRGCKPGFFNFTCNQTCPDTCAGSTCTFENGFCTDCKDGWSGDKCNTDINECDDFPNVCLDKHCLNLKGSYICCSGDIHDHKCEGSNKLPKWVGPVMAILFLVGTFVGVLSLKLVLLRQKLQTSHETKEDIGHCYENADHPGPEEPEDGRHDDICETHIHKQTKQETMCNTPSAHYEHMSEFQKPNSNIYDTIVFDQ